MSRPYLNKHVPAPAYEALVKDLNLTTPPSQYDHYFCGGHVSDLKSNQVYLQPIIPSLHAERLAELFAAYPDVNTFMAFQPQDLQELLDWIENSIRKSPGRITWVIYALDVEEQATYPGPPPLDRLAGLVSLTDFNADYLSVQFGSLIVFPPYQRTACATHAAWLLHTFAFDILGCHKVYAYTNVKNLAAQGLAKKLHYHKDHKYREDWSYINRSHFARVQEWLKDNPTRDLRMEEDTVEWFVGSMRWDDYRTVYQEKGVHAALQLTSADHYLNNYVETELVGSLPNKEVNEDTEVIDYDMNFNGPVKELRCGSLILRPFVPILHAKRLHELLAEYPDPVEDHLTSRSENLQLYEGVLRYFEAIRRDEKQFAWVMYDCKEGADIWEPPVNQIVGFIAIRDRDTKHLSVEMGPIVLLPSCRDKGVEVLAVSLILDFAMSKQGLGCFRFGWLIPTHRQALIEFAESLGFLAEGEIYFVHAPGWKHDADRALASLDKSNKFDPRQSLLVHRRWVGSVVWKDWVDDGCREKIEKILKTRG